MGGGDGISVLVAVVILAQIKDGGKTNDSK